jgi:divalent metal cation (Fe/Co/Zn/Cd) transporter
MDGVEPDVLDKINTVAVNTPGVVNVSQIRARWSGHRLEADANISVDSSLSVLDGHPVAENLEHELLHTVPHLERVIIHLNPAVNGTEPPQLHEPPPTTQTRRPAPPTEPDKRTRRTDEPASARPPPPRSARCG